MSEPNNTRPDVEEMERLALDRLAGCEKDARRHAIASGEYETELADAMEFATLSVPLNPLLRLLAERKALVEDARRWRALMTIPRIRMQGSAGVNHESGERTQGTYVHFGAEFWTDMGADYDRSRDPQNQREWGVHCLAAMADALAEIADRASLMESNSHG